MKVKSVRVTKFRNILDSSQVNIENNVTCLVGKNESGKTAFLHALYRLKPARGNVSFVVHEEYPAWLEKKDRQRGINLEDISPIKIEFEFVDNELKSIVDRFGKGSLKSNKITVKRNYSNITIFSFDTDESMAIKHLVKNIKVPSNFKSDLKKIDSFEELNTFVHTLNEKQEEESSQFAKSIDGAIKDILGGHDFQEALKQELQKIVPRFFYFSQYSKLPYSVNIKEILEASVDNLSESDLTARSLLNMAGAAEEYLLNPDYERRKRELENVANALTDDVLTYWSQNTELRVQPDITLKTLKTPQGHQAVIDELKIRIWDNRHFLSLPFDQHSTGFQWFFSFLAAFSEFEYSDDPLVILLDEPALGLHAKAQADFLRFIRERLAPKCQVIYTTHSPFMVQPDHLEEVRLVEDRGREDGAKVTEDIMTIDPDTLFPLQGALGYDMAQHLFITPNNLVVEGTSDFTYLIVISDYLKGKKGRTYIDDRWSVVPVGGADLIPTFVALLGNHLEVTVIVDSQKKGHQKLSNLADQGYLAEQRIITIGEILNRKYADLEDLFQIEDYLNLYNKSFKTNLTSEDIKGTDPIVNRISRKLSITRFDHGRPADFLLRHRDEILSTLHGATIDNFEKLFIRINSTLNI